MKTGACTEGHLDDRILEFGTFNQERAGTKTRYAYSTTTEPGWFLFNGAVKHDHETGQSQSLSFGEGRYGSESPFAPRIGAVEEDDGYLVSFITDMVEDRSECVLIDCQNSGLPHHPAAPDIQRHSRGLGRRAAPSRRTGRLTAPLPGADLRPDGSLPPGRLIRTVGNQTSWTP